MKRILIIGNALNLARRLCAYAGAGQILTTERTLSEIPGLVSSVCVENTPFKGIPKAVDIYKIASI
jgi:adenylate cyclase